MPPNQNRRRGSVSRRFWVRLNDAAGGVVVGQTVGAEEDRQRAVGILVDAHGGLDEVRPQRARRDLQTERAPFDGVVVADLAGLLDTEDLAPGTGRVGNEAGAGLLGGDGELRVVGGDVGLGEPAVGGLDPGDPGELQFLRQPVLQGAEGALRAAARFGRVGGDMLDAELPEGAADLGWVALVDLAAGRGRVEVVAAAITVERTEQAVPRHHLAKPLEARGGAFLLDQEGRVDRAGRVIERHYQIVVPDIAGEPGVARGVLVQHHADHRPARTLLAMRRPLHRRPHQAGALQVNLGHRVAPVSYTHLTLPT